MTATTIDSRVLVPGEARGTVLALGGPLSMWGGLDPETGEIIDRRHPQSGENLAGRVLVMPFGRGSSSSSAVLLEAVRLKTAPAAFCLLEDDPILALGATVARELYGRWPPIVVLAQDDYRRLAAAERAVILPDGQIATP